MAAMNGGSGRLIVAFQGEPGAYSEMAARQLFAGSLGDAGGQLQCLGLAQFSDVFNAVQKGSVMYGMIPVENTLGGSIHANYDLLLRCSDLHVVAELDFKVQHCLIASPACSRNDVKKVISHWQALAQCDGYLRAWGVKREVTFDTAGSAKMIREQGLLDTAAIASELAAETYGLEVLARGIQDVEFNHTRFLLLSREPCAVFQEPGPPGPVKTTVIFWLPHTPGALFRAVSAFAMRGLGVLKTESRPVNASQMGELKGQLETSQADKITDGKYHYVFYLDVAAHAEAEDMRNALDHLRELTPFVRVVGPYPTGGVLTQDVMIKAKAALPPVPVHAAPSRPGNLRIGIVGFGRFGSYLGKKLSERHSVFATSVEPELASSAVELGCTWVPWEGATREMLCTHDVDVLVLVVSMSSFGDVVKKLPADALRKAKPLVVDVLSVKGYPKKVLTEQLPQECDILCTHPMFGRESGKNGWHGLNFVFESVRSANWERTQTYLSIFESAGCRMVAMPCEEHDRNTASSQFITHLTGRILAAHGCEPTPIDTVGYQNLRVIADHVCKDSFELFYGLFEYNPNSLEQLRIFQNGIEDVERKLKGRLEEEQDAKNTAAPEALHINSMVQLLEEPLISQIKSSIKQMKSNGIKVLDSLCAGEPDYSPPQEALAGIRQGLQDGCTKYTVVQGDIKLRQAICADLHSRKGVEYKPSQICVSCGGQQALYQALTVVCEEGDEVLMPTPCWESYHDMVKIVRATPVPIATVATEGYILQAEALARALEASGRRCRALLLCNPCDPTGAVIPHAGLTAIAEVLRRPEHAHVFVISDEIFEHIVYTGKHVSFASLPGMHQRTVVINGFSKSHAMSGLRLGYLATGHDGVAAAAVKLQGQLTSCASSIVQRAALATLQNGEAMERWVQSRITELREKRDFVLKRLRALGTVSCTSPGGAIYVLADLSKLLQINAKAKTSQEFCDVLLSKHHVALIPGEAFHAPGTVRICYACSMEDLGAAMTAFSTCVKDLASK